MVDDIRRPDPRTGESAIADGSSRAGLIRSIANRVAGERLARPGRSRRRVVACATAIVVILGVAAALVLVASGNLNPRHTITGDYILVDSAQSPPLIAVDGSACRGTGAYGDIEPGAPVTLVDGAGTSLGTTTLAGGSGGPTECDFTFSIPGVPEVGAYTVEVSHRGTVTNTLDEMREHDWAFALSLGQ